MQWCEACCHWTLEQWRHVLWSDISCFSIWHSDGQVWVWCLPGERHLSDCIVSRVKIVGGGIMVWDCFSGAGLGPLVPVKGTLNASECSQLCGNSLGMDPSCSNITVYQCTTQVHKDMDERICCGWTWLACTESWPQPNRTPLGWITAETESQAFLSNISMWPHKCASGRMVKNSHKHS